MRQTGEPWRHTIEELTAAVEGKTLATEFLRRRRRHAATPSPSASGAPTASRGTSGPSASTPTASPGAAGLAARARGRARRPGRADDAQHRRVPHARPRRRVLRRHADLDLQLVLARAGRLPRRPLRGEGRHRRGPGVPRAVPEGPRRAARPRPTIVDLAERGRRRCSRRPRRASTSPRRPPTSRPTRSRRSSTRRAPPARPRA